MDGTQGEWNDKTRPENQVNRCQQNTGLSVARHVHPHSTPSFGPKGLFWGPESNGYAFLGAGVQWICFFWGPESNGYAFLGYQKTKGFATGYAFLGPGVQWICFFWGPEFNQYAFFGARSPMDMLFWDTRKPRDLPLDMLFWGPESHGYAFLGPGVHWICFFVIPENQGICHWICFFGGPESNFLYLSVPSYNL